MTYNQPTVGYAPTPQTWQGICMMPSAVPARERCNEQCRHCSYVEEGGMNSKLLSYITSPRFPLPRERDKPLSLYLASRYSRREAIVSYAEVLMGFGFNITSRWIRGSHQAENEQLHAGSVAEQFARDDLRDLEDADELILFTDPPRAAHPSRGGQWVEMGYALGRGIPVTIVGQHANVFCCLESILQFTTFAEFIGYLEKEGHGVTDKRGFLKA